jgi:hypothetical protein
VRLVRKRGKDESLLPDTEFVRLFDLYRTLLKNYIKRNAAYRQARERADALLLPEELFETDRMLDELQRRSSESQKGLNEMLATSESKAVLQRNISALEALTEALDGVTAKLNKRIEQVENQKRKPKRKARKATR